MKTNSFLIIIKRLFLPKTYKHFREFDCVYTEYTILYPREMFCKYDSKENFFMIYFEKC